MTSARVLACHPAVGTSDNDGRLPPVASKMGILWILVDLAEMEI